MTRSSIHTSILYRPSTRHHQQYQKRWWDTVFPLNYPIWIIYIMLV